jgi:DNA-binding LytR/AlgR family response regulator
MIITESIEKNKQKATRNNKRICIGTKHKGDYVNVHDILYVEACENYSWLHLSSGKKFLSGKPLKHYQDELQVNRFVRIHRSCLVNLSYVKAYEKKYRLLHLKGNITLSVSCRKNDSFSEMIADIDC